MGQVNGTIDVSTRATDHDSAVQPSVQYDRQRFGNVCIGK
jgi:hypothetical protein